MTPQLPETEHVENPSGGPVTGAETMPQGGEEKPAVTAGAEQRVHYNDVLKQIAQYHVPYDHSHLAEMVDENWTIDKASADAFEDHYKNMALGLYPTFAPQIKAGIKPNALFDPYRQVAKQVLHDPNIEPDWLGQAHWSAALDGNIDPKTQMKTPMSLGQWKEYVMTEPKFGYAATDEGRAKIEKATQAWREIVGKA